MARPLSEKRQQQWRETILQQKESGLSIAHWCKKNNIVIHTFYYWKDKLFPKTVDRSSFTEIPEKRKIQAADQNRKGVTIEFQSIRFFLDEQSESATLKQCLEALKEVVC